MPRGGSRPGAGRKPGAGTQKTRETAERLLGQDVTPLDYMVGVMRGERPYEPEKFEAAKAAAPYMHARLAAIEHKGEVSVRNVARLPEPVRTAEEWAQKRSRLSMQ
jgi:hypothetical protein